MIMAPVMVAPWMHEVIVAPTIGTTILLELMTLEML